MMRSTLGTCVTGLLLLSVLRVGSAVVVDIDKSYAFDDDPNTAYSSNVDILAQSTCQSTNPSGSDVARCTITLSVPWAASNVLTIAVQETDFNFGSERVDFVNLKDENGTLLQTWDHNDVTQADLDQECPGTVNFIHILSTTLDQYAGATLSVEVVLSDSVNDLYCVASPALVATASISDGPFPTTLPEPVVLDFDAGSETGFNSLYLTWFDSNLASPTLSLSISNDGSTWTELEAFSVNTGTALQEVVFTSGVAKARYWRFLFSSDTVAVRDIKLRMFDCLVNGASVCHQLAYCVAEDTCECPQGTIDPTATLSTGYQGDGASCIEDGYAIRYVVNEDVTDEPLLQLQYYVANDLGPLCLPPAQGLYVRGVPDIFSAANLDGVDVNWREELAIVEINCLYTAANMPSDIQVADYASSGLWAWAAPDRVNVEPERFTWTLPSTSNPIKVPPTGMDVTSVSFNTTCEASGCWVIKGVMTTGNAFNTYEAFNTFFLPEAISPDDKGDLSYDFPYTEDLWTFEPANHPCTSVQFGADAPGVDQGERLARVSTCCINDNATTSGGGFIENYRPTDAFIDYFYDFSYNNFLSPSSSCTPKVVERPGYNDPPPFSFYDSCYTLSSTRAAWNDARAACKALDPEGDLAVGNTVAEWEMLDSLHPSWVWSGVYTDSSGQIVNVDGSTPIDGMTLVSKGANECADTNGNSVLDLFFWSCGSTLPYVCEFPDTSAFCNPPGALEIPFPPNYLTFLKGPFKDMPESAGVVKLEATDYFFGQYEFEIHLDEVELRSKAGQLRGTVGVEHTVDTFLGLANFRPTGFAALDTFATQVAIHLEKTNFFSVSTHGSSDFTFLEYVNMRLITVYTVDDDFSGSGASTGAGAGGSNDDEAAERTVRTDKSGNKCYAQVTFTLGAKYQPNLVSGGLIPLDSVRAGKGTFFDDVDVTTPSASGDMTHVCLDYDTLSNGDNIGIEGYSSTCPKGEFEAQVAQPCGPQANMCASPTSVPDAFVSFNVPLGEEVFEDPSDDLSTSIFVDMVINAVDTTPGANPSQMKTTLTASIPIVTGGVNVFCDGYTAKTDLKDVANVDIIVGSAESADELTRLRILEDISSTQLQADDAADNVINSASIEAGLLTLVLKGNESYFSTGNSNTGGYSMELDDAITIHIMQDGAAPTCEETQTPFTTAVCEVERLLAIPADDNSDASGLDTGGYALNGAFYFTIDRDAAAGASRALLEPSEALRDVCPFNPPRPADGTTALETCITRRDVRSRSYPKRPGEDDTHAMEIASYSETSAASPAVSTATDVTSYLNSLPTDGSGVDDASCRECVWLTSILGDSDYASKLAVAYAKTIHDKYTLNGRYVRAYWINPGYEWTPTQTSGRSRFSVSQKVFLFALVSLDENWDRRRSGAALPSKRRMLLQTATGSGALEEGAASIAGAEVTFQVTPASLLASAFEVSENKVSRFEVEVALTEDEVALLEDDCTKPGALHLRMQKTFEDYFEDRAVSSAIHTVQVTGLEVNMNGHTCPSRRRALQRSLLAQYTDATATVKLMVVFKAIETSWVSIETLQSMPGVEQVSPDQNNVGVEYSVAPDTERKEEDGGSSSKVPLIAGAAGGVGGALVVGAGVLFLMKKREPALQTAEPIQSVNVAELKSQLAADL